MKEISFGLEIASCIFAIEVVRNYARIEVALAELGANPVQSGSPEGNLNN